jgi:methionyl-tRNA formyltransferase
VSASPRPRAIFFGTPEFAVPCLRALAQLADVVQVITQPDRPAGRGMKLVAPPVKVAAQELGIPVEQPAKVRVPEFAASLAALQADVAVVVAYGRILPLAVLQAPRLGCVNVHASLLPKLRGAAPIQWSIVNGEVETGVCLMQMDEGMDTGAVLARASLAIGPEQTGDELAVRLSALGADLLLRELPRFLRGELRAEPQDHARATMAPVLRKDHGAIAWQRSARELHDQVRGFYAWPGTYTFLEGARIKVLRARVQQAEGAHGEPGRVLRAGAEGIEVCCGQGTLLVTELQPEGKSRMPASAFAAGRRLTAGARFDHGPSEGKGKDT